jgi:GH35 family endo-1,4-beta-xylanase
VRVLLASLLVLLLLAAPAAATPRTGPVQLGTALNSTAFGTGNAEYRAAVGRYGAVTAESAMKLDALRPSRGQYAFAHADTLVDWAAAAGWRCTGTR